MTDSVSQTIIAQLDFTSEGFHLKGTLYRPYRDTQRVIVGCHGLLSDRTSPKQVELAKRCNAVGIAYFSFDHRGCGQSSGDFETVTTLNGRIEDLNAAVTFIRSQMGRDTRLGLFGSSTGGSVCLAAAGTIRPRAIVVFAAPIQSASIIQSKRNSKDTDKLPRSFYRQELQFDISEKIPLVDNLLLFQGDNDDTVPVSHGREIYSRAANPKKMVIQKGGDHRMSHPGHREAFLREAVAWYQGRV